MPPPAVSAITAGSPSHRPGISTRSVPGGTSRKRAIQGVVIRAATVIFMTATSHANVASIPASWRSEEHTSELQSRLHLVCRLLLEKKKRQQLQHSHVPI